MTQYSIVFPDGSEDNFPEISDKGYLDGVRLIADLAVYELSFFDPVRLMQDADGVLGRGEPCYLVPNVVVVAEVTRESIEEAIAALDPQGFHRIFMASLDEAV